VERWKVKTMSDAGAKGLHRQKPGSATIKQLASMPALRWSAKAPRSAAEKRVYSVDGCVTACALEADSDLHIVLSGRERRDGHRGIPGRGKLRAAVARAGA